MKKILLLMLLLPINVFAINQNKIHIKLDTSAIINFNESVYIYYYEDSSLIDPPLESIELNKNNAYEVTLNKGVDFENFISDSIVGKNNYYDFQKREEITGDTLNIYYKLLNKKDFIDSSVTTTQETTESFMASEIVIEEEIPTEKITSFKEIDEEEVKEEKDKIKKQEKIKERNKIYRTIFLFIGGAVIIIAIYVIIKFTQSNK